MMCAAPYVNSEGMMVHEQPNGIHCINTHAESDFDGGGAGRGAVWGGFRPDYLRQCGDSSCVSAHPHPLRVYILYSYLHLFCVHFGSRSRAHIIHTSVPRNDAVPRHAYTHKKIKSHTRTSAHIHTHMRNNTHTY